MFDLPITESLPLKILYFQGKSLERSNHPIAKAIRQLKKSIKRRTSQKL